MSIKSGDGTSSPDTCVVFFSNVTDGMVVHSSGETGIPEFGYIGVFDPQQFTDIEEEVIIWLTEGPTEPIHKAIEQINFNALRDET